MVWVGRHLCRSSSPASPARSEGTFNHFRLLRAPSNLTLKASRDGTSTTSLGNLFQCFTTLIVKNVFLASSLNLPSFSLKWLPLDLLQQVLLKFLSPCFLSARLKYWKATGRHPQSLLFSNVIKPVVIYFLSQQNLALCCYICIPLNDWRKRNENNLSKIYFVFIIVVLLNYVFIVFSISFSPQNKLCFWSLLGMLLYFPDNSFSGHSWESSIFSRNVS